MDGRLRSRPALRARPPCRCPPRPLRPGVPHVLVRSTEGGPARGPSVSTTSAPSGALIAPAFGRSLPAFRRRERATSSARFLSSPGSAFRSVAPPRITGCQGGTVRRSSERSRWLRLPSRQTRGRGGRRPPRAPGGRPHQLRIMPTQFALQHFVLTWSTISACGESITSMRARPPR